VDRTGDDDPTAWESVMVDLSHVSLAELKASAAQGADSPLARGLRRLADELNEPGEPIAGFNSAL